MTHIGNSTVVELDDMLVQYWYKRCVSNQPLSYWIQGPFHEI